MDGRLIALVYSLSILTSGFLTYIFYKTHSSLNSQHFQERIQEWEISEFDYVDILILRCLFWPVFGVGYLVYYFVVSSVWLFTKSGDFIAGGIIRCLTNPSAKNEEEPTTF